MALRHWDGFTAYSELADLDHLYVREGFSSNLAVLPDGGPQELGGVRVGGVNLSAASFYRTITSSSTVLLGTWLKWNSFDISGGDLYDTIITLRASSTVIIGVRLYTDGSIRIYQGTSTLLFDSNVEAYSPSGSARNYLALGSECRVELKALISATVGTLELRVNGAPWCALTAQNTGASNITRVYVETGNNGAGANFEVGEIFVFDGTGTFNTNFLGTWKCQILRPTSDSVVGFTPFTSVPFAPMSPSDQAERKREYLQIEQVGARL